MKQLYNKVVYAERASESDELLGDLGSLTLRSTWPEQAEKLKFDWLMRKNLQKKEKKAARP